MISPSPTERIDLAEHAYAEGRLQQAYDHYRAVVQQCPADSESAGWLAEVCVQLGQLNEAITHYRHAEALLGDDFDEFSKFGYCLYETNQPEAAVHVLQKAIARHPDDDVAHANFGRALYDYHCQIDAARAQILAQLWLQKFPDNPDARHIGAAIGKGAMPSRANPAYVRDLFECFAEDFDRKLSELDYRVPQDMARMVEACAPGGILLDLGCGTGNLGKYLPRDRFVLDGVDLSPAMLTQAKRRKCYRKLVDADIVTFLADMVPVYDVVCAADALCYFGALESVFTGVARALRPGGYFLASIETLHPAAPAPPVLIRAQQHTAPARYNTTSAPAVAIATIPRISANWPGRMALANPRTAALSCVANMVPRCAAPYLFSRIPEVFLHRYCPVRKPALSVQGFTENYNSSMRAFSSVRRA